MNLKACCSPPPAAGSTNSTQGANAEQCKYWVDSWLHSNVKPNAQQWQPAAEDRTIYSQLPHSNLLHNSLLQLVTAQMMCSLQQVHIKDSCTSGVTAHAHLALPEHTQLELQSCSCCYHEEDQATPACQTAVSNGPCKCEVHKPISCIW